MPKQKGKWCSICRHKRRSEIELALIHKLPVRVVATRYDVSPNAVFRHRRKHMPPQLVAAIMTASKPSEVDLEQLQKSESEGLLASLISQRAGLQMLSELAFSAGADGVQAAVGVECAITNSLELTSKLLGAIISHHEIRSTSILVSPDYLRLRQAIITGIEAVPRCCTCSRCGTRGA